MSKRWTRKALANRGGFASSYSGPRTAPRTSSTPRSKSTQLKPINVSPINTNSLNNAFRKAAPFAAAAGLKKLNAYIGDGIRAQGGAKVKLSPAVQLGDGSASTTKTSFLIEDQSSKERQKGNSAIAPSKIHTVRLETGNKPSSSIMKYMNMNGSNNLTIRDSRKDDVFLNGTQNQRDILQLHGGFNQKLVYMNNWIQTDIEDIFRIFGWTKTKVDGFSADKLQRFYGIAKYINESIHMTNLNSYLAVDVKIHLVASKRTQKGLTRPEPYYQPLKLLTHSDNTSSAWKSQRLPNHKVISPTASFTPYFEDNSAFSAVVLNYNYACGAYLTPDAQLRQSDEFNSTFEIIHTVKKRLNPGDRLEFKNKIGLGPGLPLHDMLEAFVREKDQITARVGVDTDPLVSTPIAYSYMIEVVGQKTVGEAVITEQGKTEANSIKNEKFLGTAPFKLQCEFKNTIEIANKTQVMSNLPDSGEGLPSNEYPIKVFTSEEQGQVNSQNFNRPYGSTEVNIQVVSDDSLRTVTAI